MERWVKGLFIFAHVSLFASEPEALCKLQALSLLKCPDLTKEVVLSFLQKYPNSKEIHLAALRLFASAGDEEQMMALLRQYQTRFPNEPLPRDDLEEMAWGVIDAGTKASAPLTRAIALIAAAMGNDARGIRLLANHISDPNRLLRGLAVEFSTHFRDERLQEEVFKRLKVEKDKLVQIALLQAVGPMQIHAAEPALLAVLENDRAMPEEKAAAIGSILALKEKVDIVEVKKFLGSQKAGLRALGAELVQVNDRKEDAEFLLPLLKDPHAEVRKAALESLFFLRVPESSTRLIGDPDPEVAMTASALLMLTDPKGGQEAIAPFLKSPHEEVRLYAAAALRGAGKYGFPLTLSAFKETTDPFVKINLALALIDERVKPELGAEAIYNEVMHGQRKLMPSSWGPFLGIGPSDLSHRADIPNYPEAMNQTTRLELLGILAMLDHPKASQAIEHFLKERPWGVSGAACALLLTEGPEEALEIIRSLLLDPSDKVKLQAALILGLWGNDPQAIDTLKSLYGKVDRQKKEQILESLGRIGDSSTLPFLTEQLEDPHQSLRMIAAAAILQTLYK